MYGKIQKLMLILKMSVIFVEALQTVWRDLQRHLSFVDNVLIFILNGV